MKKKYNILIVAGEASGDLHGGNLIAAIKEKHDISFFGIGGDHMSNQGVEILYHMRDLAFLGFAEVVRHLPFISRVYRHLDREMKRRRPDMVLLIDYPGFNLRFAKKARQSGFPVFYYISPQVWAWGKNRIKKIAGYVSNMVVILPFEQKFYRNHGIKVKFLGHPLKDILSADTQKGPFLESLNLEPSRPVLGLFPGSREQEVNKILPVMLNTYEKLKNQIDGLQATIGLAPGLSDETIRRHIGREKKSLIVSRDRIYDMMKHCDLALVASGTATLETALLGTPLIVLYRTSPVTYWMGRYLVKLKNISLVNIIAEKQIVPEFIQHRATAENIVPEAVSLLKDRNKRVKMKSDLQEVSARLGSEGAVKRIADAVLLSLQSGTKQ